MPKVPDAIPTAVTSNHIATLGKTNTMSKFDYFEIKGEQLLGKVKELINEGNVRRIIIKDKAGKEMITFPLTVGVVGAVLAPILAAVGAIATLVSDCTIAVARNDPATPAEAEEKVMD